MWPRDAYVGQHVACVDDAHPADYFGPALQVGQVYTIRWVGVNENTATVLIDTAELPSPECEKFTRGWSSYHFRPVDESRIDVFREMLKRPGVWSRDENRKDVVRADAI